MVFFLITSFSLILELLQFFSSNRAVSFMDMGSNIIGVGVAIMVYIILKRVHTRVFIKVEFLRSIKSKTKFNNILFNVFRK